jgi:tetratricopeptide (TPR) repeat protein
MLFLTIFSAFGQSPEHELANLYFMNGEYDKAIDYYEKFYNETQDPFYLQRYVECLTKTNNGKDAEKFLLRYIKKNPNDYLIAIYLGRFYEDENRKEDADKHYRKLIDELPSNANAVLELSKVFRDFRMYEWELETLLKGRKMLKDSYPFNTQLAEVYGALNRNEDMIDEYLSLIEVNPAYKTSVQNLLSRYLQFDGEEDAIYELTRERLVEKVQKNPNNLVYTEMLIWLYTHRGNYPAALIQAKALDKRDNRAGRDVLNSGITCKNFGDYKTARSAFQYVLDLGVGTPNYLSAEKELLNTLFIEITKEINIIRRKEVFKKMEAQRIRRRFKIFK